MSGDLRISGHYPLNSFAEEIPPLASGRTDSQTRRGGVGGGEVPPVLGNNQTERRPLLCLSAVACRLIIWQSAELFSQRTGFCVQNND